MKQLLLVAAVLIFSACNDINNLYQEPTEPEIKKDNFFEFSTISTRGISLSYGIPVTMTFHLYDEYPYEQVGDSWEKKDINALYAGFTDEDGNFSADVILPSYVKKTWLVTDNVLVQSPIEVEIASNSGIDFNYEQYRKSVQKAKTRANMENGISCPDGYDRLGMWDSKGNPDYLLTEKIDIPSGFLKRCNGLAKTTESQRPTLLEVYPELQTTDDNDMVIVKNTELVATYFKSSASFEDMVAYYTYQEGEQVNIETIKKTILFPRYSRNTIDLEGLQVKLKYWNNETESYQNEFPAGTHIGWILVGYYNIDKWTAASKPDVLRYSNPAYNSNDKQHSVLLMDTELDNHFFMAMEDNNDMRFNDVQFAITSLVPSSVGSTPPIPEEVGKDETVSYTVHGTLAYEDNWPAKGDYDMNDVMVNFEGTIIKKSDKVVRTTATFTAINDGAVYTNGFGIQLDNLDKSKVSEISVSRDGQIYVDQFEEGTERPVLILFSNTKQVLNKKISVDIRFKEWNNGIQENDVRPPYNPFIFVNKREHEVHLPGYIPTSRLDDSLRGTESDLRQDSYGEEMYYISKDNMPFALYISGQYLDILQEKQNILDRYPNFKNWRDSNGSYSQDWYVKSE